MHRLLHLLPLHLLLLAACQEREVPAPRAQVRDTLARVDPSELLGCAPLFETFEERPRTSVELHVDRRGTAWLAYDARSQERPGVYLASNATGTWKVELVHGLPNAWVDDLQLDATGQPHVLYTDMTHSRVLYATRAPGQGWRVHSLGEGHGEALAIDARGVVHLVHRSREGAVYVRRAPDGGVSTETVDPLTEPSRISLALDGEGRVHVAYVASRATQLFHAVREGSAWRRTLVATRAGAESFQGVDLALTPGGEPALAWVTSGDVLHLAEREGGLWHMAPVLEHVDYLRKVSLAIDAGGNHHVGYMRGDYSAAYATDREGPWRHLSLLASSFAPASLALTPSGQPTLGVLSSARGVVGLARPCPFHVSRPPVETRPGAPTTRGLAAP